MKDLSTFPILPKRVQEMYVPECIRWEKGLSFLTKQNYPVFNVVIMYYHLMTFVVLFSAIY